MSSIEQIEVKGKSMQVPASPPPGKSRSELCPVCGATTQVERIGDRTGWTCTIGGYAHYYQAKYGHLERWFTSGEGNLREPVIQAMNCVAQTAPCVRPLSRNVGL